MIVEADRGGVVVAIRDPLRNGIRALGADPQKADSAIVAATNDSGTADEKSDRTLHGSGNVSLQCMGIAQPARARCLAIVAASPASQRQAQTPEQLASSTRFAASWRSP